MKKHLTIRRAEISDLEEICDIENECFGEDAFPRYYITRLLSDPNVITFIAALKGEVIGFIAAGIENLNGENIGHIYTIDVKPKYRRKGIGSRLLDSVEKSLRGVGIEYCYLEVREDNTAAINLYLKHGYIPMEILKGYYGACVDGIKFMKSLRDNRYMKT